MRLTVLEFAERYRIKEADASKLLRRAALDGRLEVSYDDSYKATYTGSGERFLELSREYRGGYLAGAESGTTNTIGYRVICIDKVDYYAHRLAFLFMTGEIPAIVDHINGNRSDNRFINLRPSSKKLNAQNIRGANSKNGLGILGAYIGQNGRFASRIRIDGRNKFLGEFATPELAHQAYLEAKRKHHDANTL